MADNPFEDEDVQAAAQSDGVGGPPPAPQQVYGQDNAYGDAMQAAADYIPAEQKKQIAISAGSAVANQAVNAAQADYTESTKTQGDHHEAPPPPSFCIKLFNWFPIRLFAFIGGCVLIGFPILAIILPPAPEFIQFFIYCYLIAFGVVTIFIESPTWKFTRFFQLRFFFWFRLLSRMWGRAWFYLFTAILCFAPITSGGDSAIVMGFCGSYLLIICILCWVFSRMAAAKFQRMREFIAAGAEGDELEGRFMRKFDELDNGGEPGTIGSAEIVRLAEQAGRILSNSERHAIQTYLDESCNGFVSKEDFMHQFVGQYTDKEFKQKFL